MKEKQSAVVNKTNVRNSQSVLRFSLSADSEAAAEVLRKLHVLAQEQNFRHVSDIMEFEGNDCCVREDDPFGYLKIEAQGIVLANNRLLTFCPESFRAFVCQLSNKRLMAIGFARYPKSIKTALGTEFVTPWGDKEIWHGTVNSQDCRFSEHPDDCKTSHSAATNLLMHAKKLQALTLVEDSTGFWSSNCEKDLEVLECPNHLHAGCHPKD